MPSAQRLLTGDAQGVLDDFLELLLRQTRNERIHISQIEVAGMDASKELDARVIVMLSVELPDAEALALWRRLGDAIERWAGLLPTAQAEIALDFLALDIEWSSRAGAI